MIAQAGTGKSLRIGKIIQILLFVAILIYADVLYLWPVTDKIFWGIGTDNNILQTIAIGLAIWSVLGLGSGYFITKVMIQGYKFKKPRQRKWFPLNLNLIDNERFALTVHILRVAICMAVAVYGLLLGILGAAWQITLPFLVVSAAALAITFPTKKRWDNMLEQLAEAPHE